MSKPPTKKELELKVIDLTRRVTILEMKKGLRKGAPVNDTTLNELITIAQESQNYEEYSAKIEEKYPSLKEDTT